MKKLIFAMAVIAVAMGGCTENDPPVEEPGPGPGEEPGPGPGPQENPYMTGIDTSGPLTVEWTEGDLNGFLFLGHGYDATGRYAHPAFVRGQIFDMDLYDNDPHGSVSFVRSTSSSAEVIFSGTEEECRRTVAAKAGFTDSEIARYPNLSKVISVMVSAPTPFFPIFGTATPATRQWPSGTGYFSSG